MAGAEDLESVELFGVFDLLAGITRRDGVHLRGRQGDYGVRPTREDWETLVDAVCQTALDGAAADAGAGAQPLGESVESSYFERQVVTDGGCLVGVFVGTSASGDAEAMGQDQRANGSHAQRQADRGEGAKAGSGRRRVDVGGHWAVEEGGHYIPLFMGTYPRRALSQPLT